MVLIHVCLDVPCNDEDSISATRSAQSLLTERFFIAASAQVLDGLEPSLVPRYRTPLDCLQLEGTNIWLLAAPISGLQQTFDGRHYHARLRYRLCMKMFVADSICRSFRAPMDTFGGHALLCHGDPQSSGFQPRHRLVQRTLGSILQQGVHHMVEPPHLRHKRDDAPVSRRGSRLTKATDILLYAWRGD